VPSLSDAEAPTSADLTIHRIAKTHHGRTLAILGHAAECLANSRPFDSEQKEESSTMAIHVLMDRSRKVFDEFAQQNAVNRRIKRWLVRIVVRSFWKPPTR
jgi:hypothetical protein